MALFFDLYFTSLLIGYFCLMFANVYLEQHEIEYDLTRCILKVDPSQKEVLKFELFRLMNTPVVHFFRFSQTPIHATDKISE